ncbi:hypothetical protein GCM10017608_34910 [Agromyces luteolus]|nr:hypothetical protein GCM10017608_34910 [Agromyces luteolus]
MTSIAERLRYHGGVLPLKRLLEIGCTRDDVTAAETSGVIRRVRNGWYAGAEAPVDIVRAVRVGGTATGATVARLHGLWLHDDDRLHVRVRHSTGRLFSPNDRRTRLDREAHRVCVHYSTRGGFDRARDPLTLALAEMFACTDPADALATVDSALERGALHMEHLDLIRSQMPRTRSVLIDRADPLSQSGLETRIRLLLRSARIAFRAQAPIEDVGSVDFLVGDRLVIEVDGRRFHTGEAFEEDRRRDFILVARGYVVLRLSYRQVIDDWDRTRTGILALVGRGEHRWSGRGPYEPALPVSALTDVAADRRSPDDEDA